MAVKYYDIENGTCLLRASETAKSLLFESIDRSSGGQWRENASLGVRYTLTGDESGAEEIPPAKAAALAKKLGGKL